MPQSRNQAFTMNRRRAVGVLGAAAGITCAGLLPGRAAATPAEADALMKTLTGAAAPSEGKVKLHLPQIAENGATVLMKVTVDSPMTANDYVKVVHVVAEGNPLPAVASFHFTPKSGKAEVSTRIRLGKTQNVHAVAIMSNGTVWHTKEEVKVTAGGC
ncbi:thiosulfate oxidation carrier protein SoxY [Magnetospirillum sp. SS-4]|uniref:thiosulfate oxidation carrier protein SoxY n=1 Tax=Magnetospirillum sp. SS-4 TaxID=2681465 RepID=UPI00137EDA29|nr:thiosulfate oxidation carrier protein SoxY [Magnetospirillum sp. SS-4]CAA7612460.1 Sulfur oxidation Y protein [Magnetospirillum sp. SS-4]